MPQESLCIRGSQVFSPSRGMQTCNQRSIGSVQMCHQRSIHSVQTCHQRSNRGMQTCYQRSIRSVTYLWFRKKTRLCECKHRTLLAPQPTPPHDVATHPREYTSMRMQQQDVVSPHPTPPHIITSKMILKNAYFTAANYEPWSNYIVTT